MIITGSYNTALVVLSIVIATAASFTALDLAGRIRASTGRTRIAWLCAAAVAMGGGIWSMHFIAMLAFVMPMPVAYHLDLTALSLIVAIFVTSSAFAIVSRQRTAWWAIGLAGLFMGAGICSMHYIGMTAMEMAADIHYDPVIVALSFLIAVGASIIGLWLAFKTTNLAERVAAALAMGIAIAGMHYTGMAATTFTISQMVGGQPGLSALAQANLALAVSAATFLTLFLAIVSSTVDQRLAAIAAREAETLRMSEERYRNLYEALQRETAQREHAEATLRQVQKMEAVGQLTGGIAHDFNNLLTVISGNLEGLLRNLPKSPDLQRRGETAMHAAMRAAELTQRLLAFGRRQTLAPLRINVNQLVVSMSEMLGRTLGETIIIETKLDGDIRPCVVDPNQLEATLLNLALNARDAMLSGGNLTIETANLYVDESSSVHYENIAPGNYVMLSVGDTGVGISKEHLDKVFEPFFTTKEIGKGSGLGLAQVYGFVKQSGGHVTLYSEPGIGTTIRIYLRSAPDADEPVKKMEHRQITPHAQSEEQILVVEDNAPVREYSVESLRSLGYRVLEAEDAFAALKLLESHSDIDLMFTDLGLPGMNGRALAEAARKQHPRLKILYTTGYAGTALTADGTFEANAVVLQKPFARDALAKKIRAMLDG